MAGKKTAPMKRRRKRKLAAEPEDFTLEGPHCTRIREKVKALVLKNLPSDKRLVRNLFCLVSAALELAVRYGETEDLLLQVGMFTQSLMEKHQRDAFHAKGDA